MPLCEWINLYGTVIEKNGDIYFVAVLFTTVFSDAHYCAMDITFYGVVLTNYHF